MKTPSYRLLTLPYLLAGITSSVVCPPPQPMLPAPAGWMWLTNGEMLNIDDIPFDMPSIPLAPFQTAQRPSRSGRLRHADSRRMNASCSAHNREA